MSAPAMALDLSGWSLAGHIMPAHSEACEHDARHALGTVRLGDALDALDAGTVPCTCGATGARSRVTCASHEGDHPMTGACRLPELATPDGPAWLDMMTRHHH